MDNAYYLRVNRKDLAGLGVEEGERCAVAMGTERATVIIREVETLKPGLASIDKNLANKLGLPANLPVNVIRQGDVLRMGPLVGIFTARRPSLKGGEQGGYFRYLLSALRGLYGFGYVFTGQDIDWDKRLIKAFCRQERGGEWQIRKFPFPDVVYNRYLASRESVDTRNIIGRLEQFGVQSFNTALGSKWEVYNHLKRYQGVSEYLPETEILDSLPTLDNMLQKYGEVYVKTLRGHLGKNITRVSRDSRGFLIKRTGERKGKHYVSLNKAYEELGWPKASQKLLVQQSIETPGKDTHFDVRVLMQKNRYNQWVYTGAAARLGGRGMITTNLHTGGSAHELSRVLLQRGFSYKQVKKVLEELQQVARATATALEGRTKHLGDLGLDYVIDRNGKPWFLEANPRAGRRSFATLGKNIKRQTVSRPMEYALYLAGF